MLRADEIDRVYFHIRNRKGVKLAGDTELRIAEDPPYQSDELGEIYFREAEVGGQDLRVAYTYVGDPGAAAREVALVEVGETLEKRSSFQTRSSPASSCRSS